MAKTVIEVRIMEYIPTDYGFDDPVNIEKQVYYYKNDIKPMSPEEFVRFTGNLRQIIREEKA